MTTFKTCSKCQVRQASANFYRNDRRKDRLCVHCKSCMAATKRQYYQNNPDQGRKEKKKYYVRHKKSIREKHRAYYHKNKEQASAYNKVYRCNHAQELRQYHQSWVRRTNYEKIRKDELRTSYLRQLLRAQGFSTDIIPSVITAYRQYLINYRAGRETLKTIQNIIQK